MQAGLNPLVLQLQEPAKAGSFLIRFDTTEHPPARPTRTHCAAETKQLVQQRRHRMTNEEDSVFTFDGLTPSKEDAPKVRRYTGTELPSRPFSDPFC